MASSPVFYGVLCFAVGQRRDASADLGANDVAYPQLHLNLWEHGSETFLDVGLLVPRACTYERLRFYFPWRLPDVPAEDLLRKINDASSVASIFNESWTVMKKGNSDHAVVSDSSSNRPLFELASLTDCMVSESDSEHAHCVELDLARLFERATAPCPAAYVRFRVFEVPTAFYSVGQDQGDAGLVSSWTKTDDLDFRLNVRRGAPPDMERRVGAFAEFSKVHLFLMRDRRYELAFQDAAFKACRSLEDEAFWANYSATVKEPPASALKHIKSCFGYQWSKRAVSREEPVNEFRILARFRRTELSKWRFICYVIVLGALGNGAWEYGTAALAKLWAQLLVQFAGK